MSDDKGGKVLDRLTVDLVKRKVRKAQRMLRLKRRTDGLIKNGDPWTTPGLGRITKYRAARRVKLTRERAARRINAA